jgi:hypothetical protein
MIGTEGAIEFIAYSCREQWLRRLAEERSLNTCASVAWGARSPAGWVVNARDWRMGGQGKGRGWSSPMSTGGNRQRVGRMGQERGRHGIAGLRGRPRKRRVIRQERLGPTTYKQVSRVHDACCAEV